MNDNGMTREAAEAIAQKHVDLAHAVVRWFGFDRRQEITWGQHYNQAARDMYVKACELTGAVPHSAE